MKAKYILIALYIIYMLTMMSILLWGTSRAIFIGSLFFPILILFQVYYILQDKKGKKKEADYHNEWYQNK
ncbi:MAG: hypothetical protein GYB31_02225 [Bacteroidetes bacterium]|nr:hypothetical protein [Bacteroidota bacterium]